ncbi:MAG: TolC family protein [Ferruginibacter sp.]|nr:TolC family protein [Ferruginibacter sp.]
MVERLYIRMLYFCQMRYISYPFFAFICLCKTVTAQEKWDLRKIVDYALVNNISIKQLDVQSAISGLNYKQTKLNQYPNASVSGSTAFNSGRNQDPTSFNLITQSYLSAGLQLQTSADIFNWFSKRNTILAYEWQYEAAKASADKLRNDIALTVANNYLQVLLAREQENIAQVQLKQTQAQLANTRKLVNAGALAELNASELESQEALDSANYITAKGSVIQSLLVLKAYMNMDAAAPFDVAVPPVELIPIENIADLQPDAVYALAVKNLPQQRVNDFKLRAAQSFAAAAKGTMYPTIGAFGSLGSGFNSQSRDIRGFTFSNDSIGKVQVNGTSYSVYPNQPFANPVYGKTAFFNQWNQNFRQSIGLSLSIPIFNGAQLRSNYQRSKLDIRNAELQQAADNMQIKQDIYQAYNAATVALEKFNASEKSVAAAQRTYDYAQKRYSVGMMGTFELITQQNNLFRAKLQQVLNQFDYVFKVKVLEFYRGQGLKL